MFYAITVKDNIITGVHESEMPITETTFVKNSDLSAHDVMLVKNVAEYQRGYKLNEYTDGILRPIVDRINEGLVDIPDGYELIDNELVKRNVPVEEAPQSLQMILAQLLSENVAMKAKLDAQAVNIKALESSIESTIDSIITQSTVPEVKDDTIIAIADSSNAVLPVTR